MKKQYQDRALRRLKIIEGQVRGLQKMVKDEKYCVDIITQAEAVKEAISGVEDVVLENHLSTHVRHQMKSGHDARAIREVIGVYKLAQRNK